MLMPVRVGFGPEEEYTITHGFPCQFSFQRLLHTHHLSPGAGKMGQTVADVPSGLSLTPDPCHAKSLNPTTSCQQATG
jgi:hypothetical protein